MGSQPRDLSRKPALDTVHIHIRGMEQRFRIASCFGEVGHTDTQRDRIGEALHVQRFLEHGDDAVPKLIDAVRRIGHRDHRELISPHPPGDVGGPQQAGKSSRESLPATRHRRTHGLK